MTLPRLILHSLWHRRLGVLGLVLAMALAAAGVTGGLIVGDSLRASMRALLLDRLQGAELAASPQSPFRAALANELAASLPQAQVVCAYSTSGFVQRDEASAPVGGFTFLGTDGQAPKLSPREVGVPPQLAAELGIHEGDDLLVSVPQWGAWPGSSVFAQRRTDRLVRSVRRTARLLPAGGFAQFSLSQQQTSPRNLLFDRDSLADLCGAAGKANLLLIGSGSGAPIDLERTAGLLTAAMRLQDAGLQLSSGSDGVFIHSASFLLSPPVIAAIHAAAASTLGQPGAECSVYIADRLVVPSLGKETSYAVIAAIPDQRLQDDEIILGSWLAEELAPADHEKVRLDYLVPRSDGSFQTRAVDLRLARVQDVPAAGRLVPSIRGITDAGRIDAWEAPFPVDLTRVTPRDETYWNERRATPKAFVSPSLLKRIWQEGQGGSGDWLTSIQLGPQTPQRLAAFEKELLRELQSRGGGISLRDVRQEALAASQGSSDFGSLFAAMSMFLVIAAAGIALTVARLGIESRASELGLLMACGFTRRKLLAMLAGEMAAAVLLSAAAGVGLAVAYGKALLLLFAHQRQLPWELPPLLLELKPATLAVAAGCCLVVGALAFVSAWRVLVRLSPVQLLRSGSELPASHHQSSGKLAGFSAVLLLGAAVTLALLPRWLKGVSPAAAFLPAAALLLAALLLVHRRWVLRLAARQCFTAGTLIAANLASRRRSSRLTVSLFAIASFMLVSIAMQQAGTSAPEASGGFSLQVSCAVAPGYDLASSAGREKLDFASPDNVLLLGVTIVPLWRQGSGDVSCLNLARPSSATVLGVGDDLINFSRFQLRTLPAGAGWAVLRSPRSDGAIPIVGDAESMQWILKRSLGEVFELSRDDGTPLKVCLAGTVEGGLFAGQVLMDKQAMASAFHQLGSPSVFLVDVPPAQEAGVREALLRGLSAFGPQVERVHDRIARVASVQRLYMSFFVMLGAAGLLLGALGQAAVMLRQGFERRGELTVLLAQGFSRRRLQLILAAEQGALLLSGVLIGAIAALLPGLVLLGTASPRGILLMLVLSVAAGAAAIVTPLLVMVPVERNLRLAAE